MKKTLYMLIALIGFISLSTRAESNNISKQADVLRNLLTNYAIEAKKENPKPTFSADAGRALYVKRRSYQEQDVSCSSCHTDNPANEGKNVDTGRSIKPLAISANPNRFTDAKKVEKNFSIHCIDLYKKDCSAQDKGDFLTYIMSIK
jgi:cytochrome c peroxidase